MKKATVTRRLFIGGALAIGASAALLQDKGIKEVYAKPTQVLLYVAYHLFPDSKLGPSAKDLQIASYLHFVLKDQRIPKEDRDYFLKGASWVEESAYEEMGKSFLMLSFDEKEALLQEIVEKRWAERFVYSVLTYIFEALVSAPVYGSNIDEIGWKWLDHNPGFPQPSSKNEISYAV